MRIAATRGAVVAIVCVSLGLGLLVSEEAAARSGVTPPRIHPYSAYFVTPAQGAVVHGPSVRVAFHVRGKVRDVRVTVGGYGVGDEFNERGSRRVATLRVGETPGLRFGRNVVRIRTSDGEGQRSFTSRVIYLIGRSTSLIRGVAARSVNGAGGNLSLQLGSKHARVIVQVNGGPKLRRSPHAHKATIQLDADAGLRPGTNRIKILVVDRAAGRYAVRRVSLARPADVPVAGAGETPRRRAVGRTIRLDAGSSRAPRGYGLRYHWSIVEAPPGSRARLHGASRVQPTLRPDRPGRYVLAVGVAKVSRGAALASSDEAEFSSESTDETTVVSPVAAPPIGMKIETIASQGGEVGVSLGTVAGGGGFWASPHPEDALQMLVLERKTLRVIANEAFPNSVGGGNSMLAAIKGLTGEDLVVITRADPTETDSGGESPAAAAAINQALAAIGVEPVSTAVSTGTTACGITGQCSAFSAIGVPGTAVGQGDVNPGLAFGGTFRAGGLYGDMQENLNQTDFVFIDRGRVSFDTGPEEADPATITVDGKQYESASLGQPGFYVLALDAGTLQERGSFTYALGTPPSGSVGTLEAMASELTRLAADPSVVVFVRSIGSVSRQAGAWDAVAAALQQLGGSRFYFEALEGAGKSPFFAQVGPGGQSGAGLSKWTQVSSGQSNGTGRLSGLLARNSSSQWYPAEATAPGTPVLGTLAGVLTMPVEPWPLRNTPRNEEIFECVTDMLEFRLRPIQANYTNRNVEWGSLAGLFNEIPTTLKRVQKQKGCESITEVEFRPIAEQLEAEFRDVGGVQSLIKNLGSVYSSPAGQNADLETIADSINEEVGAGSARVEFDPLDLLSDSFWILSVADSPVAELANLASGLLSLVAEINQTPSGETVGEKVTTTAHELGARMSEEFAAVVTGLESEEAIYLSNWPMLRVAGGNALGKTSGAAIWAWTGTTTREADEAVEKSSKRVDFEALFPVKYALWRAQKGTGSIGPEASRYRCEWQHLNEAGRSFFLATQPFQGSPRNGNLPVTVEGSGQIEQWVFASGISGYVEGEAGAPHFPSPGAMEKMFGGKAPLFSPLSFSLGAYDNGADGELVTHHLDKLPVHGQSNEACQFKSPSP